MSPRISLFSAARWSAVALGALVAMAVLKPEPVQAQGLFDVIRGLFGGRGLVVPEDEPRSSPYQAYCVRLCDGRFFPLPASDARQREQERSGGNYSTYNRSRGFFTREYPDEPKRPAAVTSGAASADNICKAMCPATAVKVFSGPGIENAVASDGAPYTKLQNAFVYREKMVDTCSCNGVENTGLENLDAESDPTLQPGDIIVTADGPKVYRGSPNRGQPTAASFVPVKDFRGLGERERKNLSEMRITRAQEPVTAREGTAPAPSARRSAPAITVTPAEDIMSRGIMP